MTVTLSILRQYAKQYSVKLPECDTNASAARYEIPPVAASVGTQLTQRLRYYADQPAAPNAQTETV